MRNASELIGINVGSLQKNANGTAEKQVTQAYQCDFGPVVGTSVIVEVELSESDDDTDAADGANEEDNQNVFMKLADMLEPKRREERYKQKIKIIGQTNFQIVPRRK